MNAVYELWRFIYSGLMDLLWTPLWKEVFQNDSIHFLLGNYQHILVWDFYIVIIGPKYLILQAQILEHDLGSRPDSGQFLPLLIHEDCT